MANTANEMNIKNEEDQEVKHNPNHSGQNNHSGGGGGRGEGRGFEGRGGGYGGGGGGGRGRFGNRSRDDARGMMMMRNPDVS